MTETDPGERVVDFDGRDRALDTERGRDREFRQEQRKALVRRLLADPVARDWLWGLLAEFRTFETAFGATAAGYPDQLGTMYLTGRRSCGWRIWTELDDAAPDLASLMRREHTGAPDTRP